MLAISLIFLLILAIPAQAATVNERCHKEQIITKDTAGISHIVNTGEDVCESGLSDWK